MISSYKRFTDPCFSSCRYSSSSSPARWCWAEEVVLLWGDEYFAQCFNAVWYIFKAIKIFFFSLMETILNTTSVTFSLWARNNPDFILRENYLLWPSIMWGVFYLSSHLLFAAILWNIITLISQIKQLRYRI